MNGMNQSDNNVAVSFSDVSRYFLNNDNKIEVISNLNLTVPNEQFTVLVGPSGCGKSTLLRLVAGLDFPDQGEVIVLGKSVTQPKRDCGMVFQQYTSFPWLSVKENIAFGLTGTELEQSSDWIEHLLDIVGLTQFKNTYPHTLSGGMQQRLAIARTLAVRPRILLMDEPFGALDVQTRRAMQSLLLDVWVENKITVIFVTHDIEEALYLADRLIVVSPRPLNIVADEMPTFSQQRNPDLRYSKEFRSFEHRISDLLEYRREY